MPSLAPNQALTKTHTGTHMHTPTKPTTHQLNRDNQYAYAKPYANLTPFLRQYEKHSVWCTLRACCHQPFPFVV